MIELYTTIYATLLGVEAIHEVWLHKEFFLAVLACAIAWFIEHELEVYVHIENGWR